MSENEEFSSDSDNTVPYEIAQMANAAVAD
jgi:hypothetical protein